MAQQKRIEDLTMGLAEKLSAQKRSIAEKCHIENAMAVKKKLIEQEKQLSFRVTVLEGEDMKGKETVLNLNDKLKAAKKQEDDVVYKQNGLQAFLKQFQCGLDELSENITRFQDSIDRFNAGLQKNEEYMERRADEEGCKMLNDPGT